MVGPELTTALAVLSWCESLLYQHPPHGLIYCKDVCAWNRTRPGQLEFCRKNCEDYYRSCRNFTGSTSTVGSRYEAASQDLMNTMVSTDTEQETMEHYFGNTTIGLSVDVERTGIDRLFAIIMAVALVTGITALIVVVIIRKKCRVCAFMESQSPEPGLSHGVIIQSSLKAEPTSKEELKSLKSSDLDEVVCQRACQSKGKHKPECPGHAELCHSYERVANEHEHRCEDDHFLGVNADHDSLSAGQSMQRRDISGDTMFHHTIIGETPESGLHLTGEYSSTQE